MNITFYSLSDYNNGVLISKTFDLEILDDYDSLDEARKEWLEELTEEKDDGATREEFIVADYENIPSQLVGEWDIQKNFGEYVEAVNNTSKEVVDAALYLGISFDKIQDAYVGTYDSDEDLAQERIDETNILEGLPEGLHCYFDVESYARDLMQDYITHDNQYFDAHW